MKSNVNLFRSKLNRIMFRIGAVIIVSVLLFTFVLPIFYPYGQTDVFYVKKVTTSNYGEACINDEFRFYPVGKNVSLSREFFSSFETMVAANGGNEFAVSLSCEEYDCTKVTEGVYRVCDSRGTVGVVSDRVIDFYDSVDKKLITTGNTYADLYLSVDKYMKVYDKSGASVGELSKYIIRTSDGADSFTYAQKRELKGLLFDGEKNGDTVYSETLGCKLLLSVNESAVSFAKYESKTLIDAYGKPSLKHLLGTDASGTDVLARLMYGGRISVSVGIIAATLGVIIGTLIGCIAGLKVGVTDTLLMRFVDVFDSLPALPMFLIIGDAIASLFLPPMMSVVVMILIIACFGWEQTARIIRIKLIELNSSEDALAADISGIKGFRKITVILLPKILPQITSLLFMGVGSVILTESSVSFFGLGVRFPYTTWGLMLSDSTTVNELGEHPAIWLPTTFMICITVLGFYFLGESFVHEKKFENYYETASFKRTETLSLNENILEIENLTVEFSVDGNVNTAVKDFSLKLKRGEAVALVGASGCGKSVTADVITGLLSSNGTVKNGNVTFNPVSRAKVRIGYILQEPMSCFDPVMTVGRQLEEAFTVVNPSASKAEKRVAVLEMMRRVGFCEAEKIYGMYPGQLSGGMCQRIMVASVLLQSPELIIADEPCSSLDGNSKRLILDLFKEEVARGVSLIIITHSINEAEYITDNVVSFDGRERNISDTYIDFSAENSGRTVTEEACLAVKGVSKTYRNSKRVVKALSEVSFTLKRGSVLGITGDEGSGKTTLAGILAGIVRPDCGSVLYGGKEIAGIKARRRKAVKGKIQLIFQHPYNSLSKNISIGKQIREVVRAEGSVPKKDEYKAVIDLMHECGLEESLYHRTPDTLSGGQCKRVCIARALASRPEILICDEPLAYLDTDLHRQIIQLLRGLTEKYSMSMIFISHEPELLKCICDEIIVMDRGVIAEQGSAGKVFENALLKNSISQSRK